MSEATAPGLEEWTVPGYAEERLLARGVSGRVVAAVNKTTGQRVAIKYFNVDLVLRDTDFLREFRSEADQLMSLQSTHIARIFDHVEQPGRGAAIVMALVEGVSLREMIARRGPLGAEAALVVLKDSLLGLAAAHSLRLPHGDLNPDNVLIDAKGWCTLTDFGIAVKTSKLIPAAGTPAYMAPELWSGASSAPTTDIYAATAMLCESVTGKPPFSGRLSEMRRQHRSAPVPLGRFDQPLQDLIASGMAKHPADRPQSARSFVHDLEARATDSYGPDWEDYGRAELGERAAALLPLLAGEASGAELAGETGSSATVSRLARRRMLVFGMAGAAAILVPVVLAMVALPATSKARLSGLSAAATAAQVIVTPPVAASTCATSTTFTYSGTVTAKEPGTLSYRWLYSSGKQGPVHTLSFTTPGSRQVSGGTVAASRAGQGWAEIKVLTSGPQSSNQATYRLLCSTVSSGVTLSASVRPGSQTVFSCAAAAPNLTAIGSIKTKKAESVSYYWALADGQNSATRTVTFKRPGTKTLPALKITPRALPASGEAVLVVTKPVAAASRPAKYTVSCTAPISITPIVPAQAPSSTPGRSPARSTPSANPSHTKAPTSAPPTKAPPTTAPPTTTPPTTAPPTTTPPTTTPPTTAPPTTTPPTSAPPTTTPPTSIPTVIPTLPTVIPT
jgi:Protein kinase domain